jgi:hypothetical protein
MRTGQRPAGCWWGFPMFDALPLRDRVAVAKRRSQRITITVSFALHQRLTDQADYQGRSTSNLAAVLLERALDGRGLG